MEAFKTEEYYYIKVGPSMSSKVSLPGKSRVQRYGQIDFQYPPYLNINQVAKKTQESRLFQDTQASNLQFYQIVLERRLTKAQMESKLVMRLNQTGSQNQNTGNTFSIKLSQFMRNSNNKVNFTDKHVINSVDYTSLMELTVIPSFNPLSYSTLEKIMSHEDSKLTVDSYSRLENLPTEQSLGNLQRKGKFKRSSIQIQLKSDKRPKIINQGIQLHFVKSLQVKEASSQSPKKVNSPIKRCMRMRRSQLIPQQYFCEMQQIDEHQTWQHYKKYASNILYTFAVLAQLTIVFWLMNPSPKI